MSDLSTLLGQKAIIAEIVSKLSCSGSRVCLQGVSGSGKTTIAKQVIAKMEDTYPVVLVSGDSGHQGTKYLALHRSLNKTRRSKEERDATKAAITAPLRAIPVIGATCAELAKIAVAALADPCPEFLTAEQQDLLQGLQGVSDNNLLDANEGHLIIIIDNLGWLDLDTAQLILNFNLPEIQAAYPFSKKASILCTESLDACSILNEKTLSKMRAVEPIVIPRISRSIFPLVLNYFGLSHKIESDILDSVYSIVDNHLELIKQIVIMLNSTESTQVLKEIDSISLMSRILLERWSKNQYAEQLERLMCIAACVGSAFSKDEIRCAYKDESTFSQALALALRQELFEPAGEFIQFHSDILKSVAEQLGKTNTVEMHSKLTECIKLIRPGDYAVRLKHAVLSGNNEQSSILAFAVSMQAIRGERILSLPFSDVGVRKNILEDSRQAYHFMDNGEHEKAISIMSSHYNPSEFDLVQGEVVALIALNQIKRRTEDAYNAAISLLEGWQERQDEPEIWQRLMSILVTAWSSCGDTGRAQALYTHLTTSLAKRAAGDSTARTRLEALHRKADQFLTTEIAIKHIKSAQSWFGPGRSSNTPRHAFEYTASLVNLAAAQYTLGQFDEAANTASNAVHWINDLQVRGFRTTESYKALNNYVISAFRAGMITATEASSALELLLSRDQEGWRLDRSLVGINKGAFMLLEGRTDEACGFLEEIWQHINTEDLDAYYMLYVSSNLAIAYMLTGKRSEAEELLINAKDNYLCGIPKWFQNAHKRRISIMIQAAQDSSFDSIDKLDLYPSQQRQSTSTQDAWRSIGWGLLMSDIQVWTEG
ncbi:ATP-binding protein [Dickeya undicola]|uniref:ATP-binding protein n=1 Tax=Dickeya undicola TaxID=1577887 RepID=UPI003F26D701